MSDDTGFTPGSEDLEGLSGEAGPAGPQGPPGPDANRPYLPNPSFGNARGLSPLASAAVNAWQDVNTAAGVNFTGVPDPTLRYRRQGRRMVFRGTINMTLNSSFILPPGFQPIGYDDSEGLLFPVICTQSGVRTPGYVRAESVTTMTAAGKSSRVTLVVGPAGTSLVTGWDRIGWFCNDFDSANPPGLNPFPGLSLGYDEPLDPFAEPSVVELVPPVLPTYIEGPRASLRDGPPNE